jgi:hypothetical protein
MIEFWRNLLAGSGHDLARWPGTGVYPLNSAPGVASTLSGTASTDSPSG